MTDRCVICTNVYGSTFICEQCRRDPANADWFETRNEKSTGNIESAAAGANLRLADLGNNFDRRRLSRTESASRVVALVRHRTIDGRALTETEIAFLVGKSRQYVSAVLYRALLNRKIG